LCGCTNAELNARLGEKNKKRVKLDEINDFDDRKNVLAQFFNSIED
jgi:hypothetical protein